MTVRAKFTQTDIKRAFAGAMAAGLPDVKIEIDPTGKIVIIPRFDKRRGKDDSEWADLD